LAAYDGGGKPTGATEGSVGDLPIVTEGTERGGDGEKNILRLLSVSPSPPSLCLAAYARTNFSISSQLAGAIDELIDGEGLLDKVVGDRQHASRRLMSCSNMPLMQMTFVCSSVSSARTRWQTSLH